MQRIKEDVLCRKNLAGRWESSTSNRLLSALWRRSSQTLCLRRRRGERKVSGADRAQGGRLDCEGLEGRLPAGFATSDILHPRNLPRQTPEG